MTDTVRCYFHFRSPYSWLGLHKATKADLELDLYPLVKLPEGTEMASPAGSPAKRRYLTADLPRLAERAGYVLKIPEPFDTQWPRVNAAFWYAKEQGKGQAFALAAATRRFTAGADLAAEATLEGLAGETGLDGKALLEAAHDEELQKALPGKVTHLEEDQPFGVPFFVYRSEPFWGQDRVHILAERVRENA